jgi:protein gp37/ParB-like chromosome segregation protein Spo0J
LSVLGIYEVHPIADEFPLIGGEEFDALVAGIEANGLLNPILLSADGKTLVDGRNRYRACDRLNIEPRYERLPELTEQQIVSRIVSLNMDRRHLSPGQKAMLGLRIEEHLATFAKERQREAGASAAPGRPAEKVVADLPQVSPDQRKSREQAAKVVGASGRAISQAKAVQRDTPDLAAKVRAGQMALDAADKERKKREAAKPKVSDPAPKPSRVMLTLRTHTGDPVEYPQPQSAATFNETTGDGISWAAWSWNPVTGCLHGCDYCYARDIATSTRFASAYPAGFTPLFHHERLDAPANTIIPRKILDSGNEKLIEEYHRVFVCSMADLYGRWVPDEWIEKVHASMLRSPQWQYILLTKFPARYVGLDLPNGAWVGTSVDEQKRVRIAQEAFAKLPQDKKIIKWLSLEPLREPLQFDDLSMFDWVVIGAQTASTQPDGFHPAFAPEFDWVVDIYRKAREGGCQVHFKPNLIDGKSRDWVGMRFPDEYPTGH